MTLPRVDFCITRGEILRTFLYTGVIDRVAGETDVRCLSISSPVIESVLRGAGHEPAKLPEDQLLYLDSLLLGLLDVAHGWQIDSEAARERRRRHRVDREGSRLQRAKLGMLHASGKLVSAAHQVERLGFHLERRLQRGNPIPAPPPHLMVDCSHVHGVRPREALLEARRQGARLGGFLFSWDNLTSQGRILPHYDYYYCWNEQIATDLQAIYPYVAPEQVRVTGSPQFDCHFDELLERDRESFCAEVGLAPERPYVLYTTGMPNHMPDEQEIVRALARALGRDPKGPQLALRVYAKDRTGRFESLRGEDVVMLPVHWSPEHLTPLPEDGPIWVNAIRHAAAVVNVASTTSLEAFMHDVPVVNVAFNPPDVSREVVDYAHYYSFDHYRPIVESRAVALASSASDLIAQVQLALANPGEGRDARAALLQSMFGDLLDGMAGDRLARAISADAMESAASSPFPLHPRWGT